MNKLRGWFIIFLLVTLVGCKPPQVPPLPTVAVVPSSTITLTPSKTLTLTPSSTFTPSNTPTFTPTYTLTPSITLTPSSTYTSTATPTNTETPTFTPTDTYTPTFTETATSTPTDTATRIPSRTPLPTVMPVITSFTADPANVIAGSSITVHWNADADHLVLDLLTQNNGLIETDPVAKQGQKIFAPSSTNGTVQILRLTATKGNHTIVSTLTISVQCPLAWFFSPAPTTGGCPQAAQAGAFSYQGFQNGIGIYVPNNNTVYFLGLSQQAVAIPNTWNLNVAFPTITPPGGLVMPSGTIGYMWYTGAWFDGRTVQNAMGWATSAQTTYGTGQIQIGPNNEVYLRVVAGSVYVLTFNGSVGTWQVING